MAANMTVAFSNNVISTLNANYPPSSGSNPIGDRAVEIVRQHFLQTQPNAIFSIINPSSSLCRVNAPNNAIFEFLVKGTNDSGFAFSKMKIAGKTLYARLTATGQFSGQQKLKIYRVIKVNTNAPELWIVEEGTDFSLIPEPRWTGR